MKYQTVNILFVSLVLCVLPSVLLADYWSERERLVTEEKNYALGSKLKLTNKEQKVNDVLMSYKLKEYDAGYENPDAFLAGHHFFKVKKMIDLSKVFNIIKNMPKGTSLHSHDLALNSQEYVQSLTYRNDLYGCIQGNNLMLHFFNKNNVSNSCNWMLLSEMRKFDPNFDTFLKSKLTILCSDPDASYPNINSVWKAFQTAFKTIGGLITYKPVFEDFFYESLKELYLDNIKYMEFRGYLPYLYDLEGNTYNEIETVSSYVNTLKRFKEDYPDFVGARFIYAPHRLMDNVTMDQRVECYKKIKYAFPDFVAGFDLVGQEDLGEPLISFLPQLLELQSLGTKFFFHAGETNWNGESVDLNLLDAILLNSSRIGHGYAILKHPLAARLVKERRIAIEICPISNQVLKLVADTRNHPGSILIANGFPVVVANDDPSFWGAKGLRYDWYIAFMGMTRRDTDLRFLKQLAINSIEFSSLDATDRKELKDRWEHDWNTFIDTMLFRYYTKLNISVSYVMY